MKFVNEAGWDRIVRLFVGLGLLGLSWTGVVSGTLGIVAVVLGAVMLLTGAIGFCPLYPLLGFQTRKS